MHHNLHNGGLYSDILTDASGIIYNFTLPPDYTKMSTIKFVLYGSGGNGLEQVEDPYPHSHTCSSKIKNCDTGGAGAGAYISAEIPYYINDYSAFITKIEYTVSKGGSGEDTDVTVTYSDDTSIVLIAGGGETPCYNGSTFGAPGGIAYIYNPSGIHISKILRDGTTGGNQGCHGSTNGYTVSGAGNEGKDTPPVNNIITQSKTYNLVACPRHPYTKKITITSSGGGKTTAGSYKHMYYGGGGAATPTFYKYEKYNAHNVRKGSDGIILYSISPH